MLKKIAVFFLILFLFQSATRGSLANEFSETPTEIVIPSLNVSLPITASQVTYDTWEVSEVGASFGVGSSLPGLKGNTVIFAHARPNQFASLPDIHNGDYIHVFTNKDWFVYKVYKTKIVRPQDITVLAAEEVHELTLFTCFGSDYSQRYIVKANLITTTASFSPY